MQFLLATSEMRSVCERFRNRKQGIRHAMTVRDCKCGDFPKDRICHAAEYLACDKRHTRNWNERAVV